MKAFGQFAGGDGKGIIGRKIFGNGSGKRRTGTLLGIQKVKQIVKSCLDFQRILKRLGAEGAQLFKQREKERLLEAAVNGELNAVCLLYTSRCV